MNKNFKKIFVVSLIALSSLTGCKKSEDKSVVNIDFWHTFGKPIVANINNLAKSFSEFIEERDGVKVNIKESYRGGYDEIKTVISDGFSSGTTPTIAVAYPDHVADYISAENTKGEYVVNLDDYINNKEYGLAVKDKLNPSGAGVEDIVASFYEEGQQYKYDGTYSFPFMKSTEVMVYNKDIVAKAILDLGIQKDVDDYMKDISWDDFFTLCRKINSNKSKYGLNDGVNGSYPLYYDSDANFFITQSFQRDIPYVSLNEDGTGSIDFNNEKAVALLNEVKSLYEEGIMTTKGRNNEYGSNWFKNAQCVFTVGSSGGAGYSDPEVSFDAGICKFPSYQGIAEDKQKYVSQGVTLCLLNTKTSDNDLRVRYGFEFIKYLTNTQNNVDVCFSSEGYIPVRKSSYETEDFQYFMNEDDYISNIAKVVVNDIQGKYFNYPVFKGSDSARTEVEGAMKQVLLGKKSAEDALKDAYSNAVKKVK